MQGLAAEKTGEQKTEEYAGEIFINNFYRNALRLKELSAELKRTDLFEKLRDNINETIRKSREGKVLQSEAGQINSQVREKLRFLENEMKREPKYEGVGSVGEIDYKKNKERGATHRGLVFKIGKNILTIAKNFNDIDHLGLARAMYQQNEKLFKEYGISANDIESGGARLYIQKAERNRLSPKDDGNNRIFLKYTEFKGPEDLTESEKAEKTKELRRKVLKRLLSDTKT